MEELRVREAQGDEINLIKVKVRALATALRDREREGGRAGHRKKARNVGRRRVNCFAVIRIKTRAEYRTTMGV